MELCIDDNKKNEVNCTDKSCIKIVSGLEHRSEKIYGPYDIFDLDFHPKHTRISAYSGDISLQIEILWTFKKEDQQFGPSFLLRVPPKMWRNDKLELVTRWFYIRVSRTTMQVSSDGCVSNDILYFELRSMKNKSKQRSQIQHQLQNQENKIMATLSEPPPSIAGKLVEKPSITIIEEERSSGEVVKRSSSPFRRHSTSKGGGFFSKDKKKLSSIGLPANTNAGGNASSNGTALVFDTRLPTFIPEGAFLVGGKNGRIELLPKAHCAGLSMMSNEDSKAEWSMVYPPKM